jgi:dsDNA-binding SOS-regulon protein
MPANNEDKSIDNGPRGAYDSRVDVRLAVVEKRVSAVEVDVAVIRSSFATKDDVQSLRKEIYSLSERMVSGFAEQKLEFNMALAKQREDFHAALAKQNEESHAALAKQNEEFRAALAKQSEEFHVVLAKLSEEFHVALAKHREEFLIALAGQRDEFRGALSEQRIDLYKMHTAHIWRLYGFASLLMTGVYFIARYVH